MNIIKTITLTVLLALPFSIYPWGKTPALDSLEYAQNQVKMWDISAYATDGDSATLKGLMDLSQTKPVLLFIWAPWCGYCKQIMPAIESLYKKGVPVAGIPLDDTKDNVAATIAQYKISFPQLYGRGGGVISREDKNLKGFNFPGVPVQLILFKGEVKFYVPGSYGKETEKILTEELKKYPGK